MTYRDLYQHVRSLFQDHWSTTPFVFANESSDPPVVAKGLGESGYPASWVDVSTEFLEADYLTYDDSQCDGFVRLTFWVQAGAGEDHLFYLFDQARTMFGDNGDVEGSVQFIEPRMVNTLELEDQTFFGRETHIPFKLYLQR